MGRKYKTGFDSLGSNWPLQGQSQRPAPRSPPLLYRRSLPLARRQVNDFPDFLHGKDREFCQHIRITYVTEKPARRGRQWLRRDRKAGLPAAPPAVHRRTSHCPTVTYTLEGEHLTFNSLSVSRGPSATGLLLYYFS